MSDKVSILQLIVTVMTVGAALYLYLKSEEGVSKAEHLQAVTINKVHPDWYLVNVNLSIKNVGKIPISVGKRYVDVEQVLPLKPEIKKNLDNRKDPTKEGKTKWPILLAYSSRSPIIVSTGETDSIDYDFYIPKYYKVIKIYSFINSKEYSPLGWHYTTFYSLQTGKKL